MVGLAAYIAPGNDRYLSDFNIYTCSPPPPPSGFIALGQNIALLTGGIDLSVGPLAGFLVVVSSFYVNDGTIGRAADPGARADGRRARSRAGLVNGSLIRFGKFTPIAATLTLYIALGGFAFLLRSTQGGFIWPSFQNAMNYVFGPIPAAFIGLVVIAVLAGVRARAGVRGAGGSGRSAPTRSRRAASASASTGRSCSRYVGSSLLVFLGASC